MTEEISKFDGQYGFLSNFYPARITYEVNVEGYAGPITGPTLEHVYQSCKAKTWAGVQAVLGAPTAGQSKAKGRRIVLRDDWTEEKRIEVMRDLLRLKFEIPALRKQLLATGSRWIVEGNTWGDTFWGVCRGKGKNMLGLLLMEVRHEIRNVR
jgi:ribA/ribD-fused uncharacterized protein